MSLSESISHLMITGYDLTPTMRDVNKKFSVRYFLNLVLVDEEDRRYFKQQVTAVLFYITELISVTVSPGHGDTHESVVSIG